MNVSRILHVLLAGSSTCTVLLIGCSSRDASLPDVAAQTSVGTLHGSVYGGHAPIVNAHIYVLEATSNGTAPSGYAGTSKPLLLGPAGSGSSQFPEILDTSGGPTNGYYYIQTDSTGSFNITGDYTCDQGQPVYLYALGGSTSTGTTQGANNPAIVNLAMLGNCPSGKNFASTISYVYMNEVSTIATVFAMAGFGTDGLDIGSSAANQLGLQIAASNASNLYDIQGGNVGTGGGSADAHIARATTQAGNGTVPQSLIDSLGNILASCVDSANTTTVLTTESSQCSGLFGNATSNGIAYGTTGAGTIPVDTATAAFNIAHHPGANVSALFNVATNNVTFSPTLSAAPKDFTIAIVINSIATPEGIAFDSSGNAYVGTNSTSSYVTKLSPMGAVLATSASGGNAINAVAVDSNGGVWATAGSSNAVYAYTSALGAVTGSPFSLLTGNGALTLNAPTAVATDNGGDIYVTDGGNSQQVVAKLSGTGALVNSINNGCLTRVAQLALDKSANVWTSISSSNTVCEVSNPGGSTLLNQNGQFPGVGSIAIDGSGNAWVPVSQQTNLAKITPGNSVTEVGVVNNVAQGGLAMPLYVAIDGASNVWVTNSASPYSVSEFSSAGAPITGTSGYQNGNLNKPGFIAIDRSGDVWITNQGGTTVTEMIGAGYPVAQLSALAPGVKP